MVKNYAAKSLPLIIVSVLLLTVASCKKDNSAPATTKTITVMATPAKFGLYEADSSIYKLLLTAVSKIGTNTTDYYLLFDTGSGGMVIDANGILPSNMITNSGFTFTGDSTIVDGITITNKKSVIEYGDDASTTDKVYGNLAYAPVTVGDQNDKVVIKRLAFFIYYKAVDNEGNKYDPHEFDTFGVSPEYDITFSGNVAIESPLSYYEPGSGLTKGFKMQALGTGNFSYEGTYVPGVITLGLTPDDISSSGFVMHTLEDQGNYGYSPVVPATITYDNKNVKTDVVFDTGTEPYSYIEDKSVTDTIELLPANTSVSVATNAGFSYQYTTSNNDNLTFVENPNLSGGEVSVLGLEFFLTNEYMLDYTDHKLGVKTN
jgi:hypothetical protein